MFVIEVSRARSIAQPIVLWSKVLCAWFVSQIMYYVLVNSEARLSPRLYHNPPQYCYYVLISIPISVMDHWSLERALETLWSIQPAEGQQGQQGRSRGHYWRYTPPEWALHLAT